MKYLGKKIITLIMTLFLVSAAAFLAFQIIPGDVVTSILGTEATPEMDKYLSFVCLRPDGAIETPSTVSLMCRRAKEKVPGLEDFHFHMLRHTFTSNLLSYGAAPKDVQELLGHSDVNTTMNIYAHATREAKRSSARLLDKVVSSG